MKQRADSAEYRALRIERLTENMTEGIRKIYASGDQLMRLVGTYETNRIWIECAKRVADE